MSERNSKLRTRSARTENDGALKTRHLSLDVRALDREKRTLPISFSSETREVQTWDYELGGAVPEILSHAEGACDLSPLINAGSVLRNHDPNQIVGVPLEAKIDAATKRSTAMIRFGTTDCAEQTFREVSDGILRGVSVGYEVLACERIKAGARSSSGHEGPCLVATKWRVHELTLTPIPADSSVGVGRSKGTPTNHEEVVMPVDPKLIRKLVRAAGLPAAFADTLIARSLESEEEVLTAIEDENKTRSKKPAKRKKAAVAARMDTEEERAEGEEEEDDEGEVVEEEARNFGQLAERKRASDIRATVRAARLGDDVADDLVEKGTSLSKARAVILEKLAQNDQPAIGSRGFETVRGGDGMEKRFRFLSANLARSAARGCGLDDADAFNDGDLKKVENGYVSLQGSVREVLALHGVAGARDMQPLALWENFLRRSIQIRSGGASNSSGDLANLLSNLQNKSLSRGYALAAPTWRSWARKGTLNDFKISPWVQMSDAAALKETGENGEILDSKLSDRAENRQLGIYARSVSLTWEMFQNDDVAGLGRLSFMLGKSAAQLPSRLVYASLLANPTMSDSVALFHAASHGNLETGATSNLDDTNKVAALKAAIKAFRKQTAPKAPNDTEFPNEPVDITPRVLIVPPEHEYAAYQLVNPNLFVAETQFFKNKFIVEVEPRLSNTGYSGSSLTAWYLAAAAEDADTMEVSFLNGNEAPQTMNWEDFDRLALRQRVVLPCGVKPLDWRTIVKSNGA